jgi:DNA-binding transcriptional LysR family regulator
MRTGKLVPLLRAYEPEPVPVHLVHPARGATSAKVRTFVDMATPALRTALGSRSGKTRRALRA